ncbi:GNAT family N-acetyltransferase, partial [bacterium]|nr:GNAT family N-acetyltransferase [bacterium]
KQLLEIRDPNRWIEIAWLEKRAVGFLHLIRSAPDPSVTGPEPVELLRLYVESRCHGNGVGPALMNRSIEIAQRQGFKTFWLGVWERNLRAQAFYEKFGFKRVGSHNFKVGSDDQMDLIMTRSI